MSIAIGFGSTEQEFEEAERKAFEEYVSRRYLEMECRYITDELVEDVAKWLKERADGYHDKAAQYKASDEYPARYSYYWPHLIWGATDIIARISFHHINRRHALSPDGWGLMVTKRLFDIQSLDIEYKARAA